MPAGAGGAGERGECARALDEGQHTVRVVLWSIQTSLRTSWPFGRVGELSRKADARRRREVLGHHPRPGGSTHPLATPHVSYPRPRRGRVRRDLPRRAGSAPSHRPPAQRLSATGVRPALAPRAPPSASIHGHLPATLWGCAVALSGARLRLARRPTVEGQTAQAEHTAFTGLPSVRHVTPTSLGRRSPSVGDPRWASRAAKLRAAWHRFT